MYFEALHARLLATLRAGLHNGRLTERNLARLTGISQPHVHNILKGARVLTPDIADLFLKTLHLSVLDLIESSEMETVCSSRPDAGRFLRIPVLRGLVGPGHAWPSAIDSTHEIWMRAAACAGPSVLVALHLAPDPLVFGADGLGGVALLDTSPMLGPLDPDSYYAISHRQESFVRKPRQVPSTLFPEGVLLDAIRGLVIWMAPDDGETLIESAAKPKAEGIFNV